MPRNVNVLFAYINLSTYSLVFITDTYIKHIQTTTIIPRCLDFIDYPMLQIFVHAVNSVINTCEKYITTAVSVLSLHTISSHVIHDINEYFTGLSICPLGKWPPNFVYSYAALYRTQSASCLCTCARNGINTRTQNTYVQILLYTQLTCKRLLKLPMQLYDNNRYNI